MSLSQNVCFETNLTIVLAALKLKNVGHWGFQGDPPASVPRLLHSGITAVCWPNLAKIGSKKNIVCVFICRGCMYVSWCMEVRGQSLMLVLWRLLSFWDRVSLACLHLHRGGAAPGMCLVSASHFSTAGITITIAGITRNQIQVPTLARQATKWAIAPAPKRDLNS